MKLSRSVLIVLLALLLPVQAVAAAAMAECPMSGDSSMQFEQTTLPPCHPQPESPQSADLDSTQCAHCDLCVVANTSLLTRGLSGEVAAPPRLAPAFVQAYLPSKHLLNLLRPPQTLS